MIELNDFVKLQEFISEYVEIDGHTHVFRIAKYSSIMLKELGKPDEYAGYVGLAAALHDIGKLFVPAEILSKPGKLTPEEFELIKPHCSHGHNLMSPLNSNFFHTAGTIALYHHENWNGSGYPHGISGKQIPFNARVISIIDVFDSLVHTRVYKKAWTIKEAMKFINDQSGKKFDPEIVEVFDRVIAKFAGIVELEQQRDIDIHEAAQSSS